MYFMVCAFGDPREEKYLPVLNGMGIGVELQNYGLTGVVSMPAWEERFSLHKAIRPKIAGRVAVHGPYMGLAYDYADCLLKEAVRKRMDMIYEAAKVLKPDTLIMHSGYNNTNPQFGKDEIWMKAITGFWREEIKRYSAIGTRVVIENMEESDPDLLIEAVGQVNSGYLGLCLDVGHANIFSDLKPSEWVKRMGKWLMHLHVHDNKGDADNHMPLGKGNIDFQDLFGALHQYTPDATVSLEVDSTPETVVADLQTIVRFGNKSVKA